MKQEVERQIDGNKYIFYQCPPSVGTRLLMKLARILGEPLGLIGEEVTKTGGLANILNKDTKAFGKEFAISKIINSLISKLDEEEGMNIIQTLCKYVYFEGKNLNEIFEVHFQGEYLKLTKVIKAALEVQYGNFLQELFALISSNPLLINQEKQT